MSFFTSLTGLNAATTQLSVTSNNIANAGTTGFKRSRSDFCDIFCNVTSSKGVYGCWSGNSTEASYSGVFSGKH